MDLFFFIKFGYTLVVVSILLMVWVSLNSVRAEHATFTPCYFNPLCTCSKSVTDLGIVRCADLYLPRIPDIINTSKVFALHMENNQLSFIEPYFLQSSGLCKLTISKNDLYSISDESFIGLERTLWELHLTHNHLFNVPSRALRFLRKLQVLDLRGNEISAIAPENFKGLEDSLEELILAENSLLYVPPDAFTGLPHLDTIDLTGNHLREIDPSVFREGMGRLANLILADNELTEIPYQALSPLKTLRVLDLSYNQIKKVEPTQASHALNFKLRLNVLKLDYNEISVLVPAAFQNFEIVNMTYLDGNILSAVQDSAFRQAKIRELYMRRCGLTQIYPEAFDGLEDSLEILDLSGNNLTTLPNTVFHRLNLVSHLSLRDNPLSDISIKDVLNGLQFTLHSLDLRETEIPSSIQDMRWLKGLRHLALSELSKAQLSYDDFVDFGLDVEHLQINSAHLKVVANNAFKNIHSVKTIDLSDNVIENIEKNAFIDTRLSLISLKLSHAFASSYQTLPVDALRSLVDLQYLDLSNNRIKNVPDISFQLMYSLKVLKLHDNLIEQIPKGTFEGSIHRHLEDIFLSFNSIKFIQTNTFANLVNLRQIHLDDNRIDKLERFSFTNLESLQRLSLKGNDISIIAHEAFHNLPELEDLDLSYNEIKKLEFPIFDQAGTLSMFRVNLSYNKLQSLETPADGNINTEPVMGINHASVKVLDLSHNNISLISNRFFRPVELSLLELKLSFNKILKATTDVFGNMVNLQLLDLSHNRILEFEQDTFKNTKKLQIFSCAHNYISDIPIELFRSLKNLRVVDLSHNRLKALSDNLFRHDGLQSLDISHNALTRIPLTSLNIAAAGTLCNLDLSYNGIPAVTNGGLFIRFKNLNSLDLSHNKIIDIDTGVFAPLYRLYTLNLGHNTELVFGAGGAMFKSIEETLLHLNLDNVSLTKIPDLPLPSLISLSLSHNSLPTVSPELAINLNSLQNLDLSHNDLTAIPVTVYSFLRLRRLSLGFNPIMMVSNESFYGISDTLVELNLMGLQPHAFEMGIFDGMPSLRTLKIGVYHQVARFSIPLLLENSYGLKNLEIYVEKESSLAVEMSGALPPKLNNISFSGRGVKVLSPNVLHGVKTPTLTCNFVNTSMVRLNSELFKDIGRARNVSLYIRDNKDLENVQNPSTGDSPGLHRKTFLTKLKVAGNKLHCDCDIGWIEVWDRKRRQYLCDSLSRVKDALKHDDYYACVQPPDDMRVVVCHNKANKSLVEVLKTDLECGWNFAGRAYANVLVVILLFVMIGVLGV